MAETSAPGDTLQDIVGFKHPLPHLAKSLKEQRNTKIVAFGSSSTAGTRLVVPYPAWLELMLRDEFGIQMINEFDRSLDDIEVPKGYRIERAGIKPDMGLLGDFESSHCW